MSCTRGAGWVGFSALLVLSGCGKDSAQIETSGPGDTVATDAGRDRSGMSLDASEQLLPGASMPVASLPGASMPDAAVPPGETPSNNLPETPAENTAPPAPSSAPSASQMNEPSPPSSGVDEPAPAPTDNTDAAVPNADELDAGAPTQAATEPQVRLQVDAPEVSEPQLLGDVVAGVDDIDDDGWADFVASSQLETATFDGGSYQGRVRVYSGFDGRELYELTNPDPQEQQPDALFGHALLGLDDLTGDRVGEIAVGARRYDSEARVDAGRVYVFDGADGSLLHAIAAPPAAGWFGAALQLAEDVDEDYVREILVAASNGAAAYLLSPVSGAVLATFESPMPRSAFFGQALATLGDINGDATGDVAIGDYSISDPPEAGRVHLFSGTGELLTTLEGSDTRFGFGIAAVGDVNGDGTTDLAIDHATGVDVISGAAPEETLYSLASEAYFFGERLLSLPDQDCDGVWDFAVAARDWSDVGGVFIYSGASGAQLFALAVPELPPQARFGRYLALLQHPERDNGIELLVTATGANENRGAVFTFSLLGPASCPD